METPRTSGPPRVGRPPGRLGKRTLALAPVSPPWRSESARVVVRISARYREPRPIRRPRRPIRPDTVVSRSPPDFGTAAPAASERSESPERLAPRGLGATVTSRRPVSWWSEVLPEHVAILVALDAREAASGAVVVRARVNHAAPGRAGCGGGRSRAGTRGPLADCGWCDYGWRSPGSRRSIRHIVGSGKPAGTSRVDRRGLERGLSGRCGAGRDVLPQGRQGLGAPGCRALRPRPTTDWRVADAG